MFCDTRLRIRRTPCRFRLSLRGLPFRSTSREPLSAFHRSSPRYAPFRNFCTPRMPRYAQPQAITPESLPPPVYKTPFFSYFTLLIGFCLLPRIAYAHGTFIRFTAQCVIFPCAVCTDRRDNTRNFPPAPAQSTQRRTSTGN